MEDEDGPLAWHFGEHADPELPMNVPQVACRRAMATGQAQPGDAFKASSDGKLPRMSLAADIREFLDRCLNELASHYVVEALAAVVRQTDGALRALACRGLTEADVRSSAARARGAFSFFRHHVARDLPIIIGDASAEACRDDPLVAGGPRLRFYAAAPFKLPGDDEAEYSGTLCIASSEANLDFGLMDADFLLDKVAELSAALRISSIIHPTAI